MRIIRFIWENTAPGMRKLLGFEAVIVLAIATILLMPVEMVAKFREVIISMFIGAMVMSIITNNMLLAVTLVQAALTSVAIYLAGLDKHSMPIMVFGCSVFTAFFGFMYARLNNLATKPVLISLIAMIILILLSIYILQGG